MALTGRLKTLIFALTTASLITGVVNIDASARKHKKEKNSESSDSPVSMEFFPIKRGYDGAQFVVTKQGYLVSLPGLGVAPDATQVAAYRDAQNNIWYIDHTGTAVKLTPEQIQWGMAQINQQAQARAAASNQETGSSAYAAGQQPSQTVVVQQPANQGSSGGGLATGLAAAGGAAAGVALSSLMYNNNYHGIPYGTPVYHNGGRYYYNGAGGNKVYINNSGDKYINQWNHQTNWQNNNNKNPHPERPTQYPSYSGARPTQLPSNSGARPTQYPSYSGARPTQYPSNSAAHFASAGGQAQRRSAAAASGHVEHSSRAFGNHGFNRSGAAARSVGRAGGRGGRRR